jgi:replication factor A1
LTISDDTGSIVLSLWNEQAEMWTMNQFPVIIGMKNCRVKTFNGKVLGSGDGFRYELSPSTQAAVDLQEWYEKQDAVDVFANLPFLSSTQSNMASQDIGNTPVMSISEGINLVKGKEGKAEFFGIRATITLFKHDQSVNMTYDSCPAEKCLKKVTENPDGSYYCDKCKRNYPDCHIRYVLNMVLADSSTSTFVSVFDEAGTVIVGQEASEIKKLRQMESPDLPAFLDGIVHLEAIFKIKAAEELYNDEYRAKCAVLGAYPIDYIKESASIISKIKTYL